MFFLQRQRESYCWGRRGLTPSAMSSAIFLALNACQPTAQGVPQIEEEIIYPVVREARSSPPSGSRLTSLLINWKAPSAKSILAPIRLVVNIVIHRVAHKNWG